MEYTGQITSVLADLRLLIASCPNYQAWCDHPGDSEATAGSIYLLDYPPPTSPDGSYAGEDADRWPSIRLSPFRPSQVRERTDNNGVKYLETVYAEGGDSFVHERAAGNDYATMHKVMVRINDRTPFSVYDGATTTLNPDAMDAFYNRMGLLIKDLMELSSHTGYLTASQIADGRCGVSIHGIEVFMLPTDRDTVETGIGFGGPSARLLLYCGV